MSPVCGFEDAKRCVRPLVTDIYCMWSCWLVFVHFVREYWLKKSFFFLSIFVKFTNKCTVTNARGLDRQVPPPPQYEYTPNDSVQQYKARLLYHTSWAVYTQPNILASCPRSLRCPHTPIQPHMESPLWSRSGTVAFSLMRVLRKKHTHTHRDDNIHLHRWDILGMY